MDVGFTHGDSNTDTQKSWVPEFHRPAPVFIGVDSIGGCNM